MRLTTNPGLDTTPRDAPDGRSIAYLSMARQGYESDQNDLVAGDRRGAFQDPDEGHMVGKIENLRDVYDKQLGWLARWLR